VFIICYDLLRGVVDSLTLFAAAGACINGGISDFDAKFVPRTCSSG
jgi:hypothetical protein